jgi:hypothetical protein
VDPGVRMGGALRGPLDHAMADDMPVTLRSVRQLA